MEKNATYQENGQFVCPQTCVHHVLHGRRWKRLRSPGEVLGSGAGSDKRGRLSLHEHGFFPREGVG